jgi:hypothetical protein
MPVATSHGGCEGALFQKSASATLLQGQGWQGPSRAGLARLVTPGAPSSHFGEQCEAVHIWAPTHICAGGGKGGGAGLGKHNRSSTRCMGRAWRSSHPAAQLDFRVPAHGACWSLYSRFTTSTMPSRPATTNRALAEAIWHATSLIYVLLWWPMCLGWPVCVGSWMCVDVRAPAVRMRRGRGVQDV